MTSAAPERCPVTVVWDDRFLAYDLGEGHPFTEASRAAAVDLLDEAGFFPARGERMARVEPAPETDLGRFHQAAYLQKVRRVSASPRRIALDGGDTPSFPGCYEAAARIAGGTLAGLAKVLEEPGHHVLQPAGGLHHAHPGSASGFCIFNDVAVALAAALASGRVRRVAYVDIDAHHGDGVMYGFYTDGRVLDIDLHQDGRTLFPGTGAVDEGGTGDGAGLKANLPLAPGASDRTFLDLFSRVVPVLLREFRPELIVLQTGVDGHVGDPLAQLAYTTRSYRGAVAIVHALAHELCGGRLLATGGGGYRAQSVAETLALTAMSLSGPGGVPEPGTPLPARWPARFEARLGVPARPIWEAAPTGDGAPAPTAESTRLIERLEGALGRAFPAVG